MLCTLTSGGHLDGVSAVVAGEFEACHPGPDGVTVDDVLLRAFSGRGIPVITGVPIGHGSAASTGIRTKTPGWVGSWQKEPAGIWSGDVCTRYKRQEPSEPSALL